MSLVASSLLTQFSKTLNSSPNVSIETKQRINNAIRNYREKFMFINKNETEEHGKQSSVPVIFYLIYLLIFLPIILAVVVPIILIWKIIPGKTNIILKLLYMFVGGFIGFFIGGFITYAILFRNYNK